MYLITEPYDGTHVRILAAARTPEAAERKFRTVARRRRQDGYTFFGPVRQIIAPRHAVDGEEDFRLAAYPTWQ